MRPPFAVAPGPGQVSVWDFPRPPRLEAVDAPVRIEFGGEVVAATTRAVRVCETASPPTYYVPWSDVRAGALVRAAGSSFCEWKGQAAYWTVRTAQGESPSAAWSYPTPAPAFGVLRDYVAFYPGRVDGCWVGDERVRPQPGGFYGGWITADLVGPFKGEPGTGHW
ncbi:MAG: DUF427 domain-containing protein [Vicinamibacterales bacterium]